MAPVREGEGTLVLATQLLRGAEEASGKRIAMLSAAVNVTEMGFDD